MKKTGIFILLLLGALQVEAQNNGRLMDANDPNRNPDWSWTQEYPEGLDMYYELIGQTLPVKVPAGKQTPFFTSGHPLNTVESKKDMWPEDGWVLVYRDFGTATSAPPLPFFILYNKYRGILRHMFYNAQNLEYTFYRAELSFSDPEFSGALMTFSADEKVFLNDYDAENTLNFMSKVAVFQGWGYADFHLFGYDPTIDINTRLRLAIIGVDQSLISLKSTEFTLEQQLDEAALEGSKGSGGDLIESFNKGQKFYKSSEKAIKGLKRKVESEQKKIDTVGNKPWWFDKLSTITESNLITAIPLIGSVAGFIKSFFFSDDATPKPIKFEGSL